MKVLTTKDLKKPHSSKWVGETELWRQVERRRDAVLCREATAVVESVVPHSCVVDKNWEDTFGASDPSLRPDHSPGFQCQEEEFP